MALTDWSETGSADNAELVVTRSAESGKQHVCTCIAASYGGSQAGLLVLATGSRTILEVEVFDELDLEFTAPIRGDEGQDMTLTFDASGSAGNIGYAALMGFTI